MHVQLLLLAQRTTRNITSLRVAFECGELPLNLYVILAGSTPFLEEVHKSIFRMLHK